MTTRKASEILLEAVVADLWPTERRRSSSCAFASSRSRLRVVRRLRSSTRSVTANRQTFKSLLQ